MSDVWRWSAANEPGYEAGITVRRAEDSEASAIERERYPAFSVEGAGDWGQRVRPGEERDQGIAARGEVLARVDWILRDSARAARERAVALRRAGVAEAEAAFDLSFRAEVARTYVRAAVETERASLLADHFERFAEISELARLRIDRGVESSEMLDWLETAAARHRAEMKQARDRAEGALLTLAAFAGREVRPAPPRFEAAAIQLDGRPAGETLPAVAMLEREADVLRGESEVLRGEGRWQVGAFAAGGPYFSEAFDGRVEPEYIGGIRFVWRPDLAGVREARATASRQRANALRAEANSESRRFARRAAEIARNAAEQDAREAELREAAARAAALERTTVLRWQNGVGGWRDVLDSREAHLRARIAHLDWQATFAAELVEYAEITNRLKDLPGWLGEPIEPEL